MKKQICLLLFGLVFAVNLSANEYIEWKSVEGEDGKEWHYQEYDYKKMFDDLYSYLMKVSLQRPEWQKGAVKMESDFPTKKYYDEIDDILGWYNAFKEGVFTYGKTDFEEKDYNFFLRTVLASLLQSRNKAVEEILDKLADWNIGSPTRKLEKTLLQTKDKFYNEKIETISKNTIKLQERYNELEKEYRKLYNEYNQLKEGMNKT